MNTIVSLAEAGQSASTLQLIGAGCFGAIVGWYVYYINRYRKSDVQWSDLVTMLGIIGGTAILALFPAGTDLFGAYGIGLAIGFFGYLFVMMIMVAISKNFEVDWFLDGRRKLPDGTIFVPQIGTPTTSGTGMEVKEPPAGGPR